MSKKIVKIDGDVTLAGFTITYSDSVSYNKDKVNTAVTLELKINGKVFEHTAYMWQFEVSEYLNKFGAEL